MQSSKLSKAAGKAVLWKGIQLVAKRGFSIARLLILARLLLPEDFGLFSIALLVVETISSLTDVGIIPALVQTESNRPENYDNGWTINFFRGVLVCLLTVIFAPFIAELFKAPEAVNIIRFLAFRPLLDAVASIKVAELTRKLDFRSLTFIQVPAIALETIIAIVFATTLGVWALVLGVLISAFICVVSSYIFAPYRPRIAFQPKILRPLIQYGRWVFLTKVVAIAGSSVLQVVISRQLGVESLGLYYLGMKLAFLPYEIAIEVVGAISFPLYARIQNDTKRIKHAFQTVFIALIALLAPMYGLLICLAPQVVIFLLGDKWEGTVEIIQILSFAGLIGLLADSIVPLFQGIGRPSVVTLFELVQSLAIIGLIWWLAEQYGLFGAAFAWFPAILLSQICGLYFLLTLIPNAFEGLGRKLFAILLSSLVGISVAWIVGFYVVNVLGLIVALTLGAILIYLMLLLFDQKWHLGLLTDFLETFPQALPLIDRVGFLKLKY